MRLFQLRFARSKKILFNLEKFCSLYIMAKKDKKVNAWQIIVAVFQALAALFGSLKKSHDSAKAESDSAKAESSSEDLEGEE